LIGCNNNTTQSFSNLSYKVYHVPLEQFIESE